MKTEMAVTTKLFFVFILSCMSTVGAQFVQINTTQCTAGWLMWSSFGAVEGCSPCDPSAAGTRRRSRICPTEITEDCFNVEVEEETLNCNCAAVSGQFGAWSEWATVGRCSALCGTGSRTLERSRACDSPPPANGGLDCVGDRLQTSTEICRSYNFRCNYICTTYDNNRILTFPRRNGQFLRCTNGNAIWNDCSPASVYRQQLQRINSQLTWFNFNYNLYVQRNNLQIIQRLCAAI